MSNLLLLSCYSWINLLTQGISDTVNIGAGFIQDKLNRDRANVDYERNRKDYLADRAHQESYTASREDTAIQRRASDMKMAGINPVLAAGQPASSQPSAAPSPALKSTPRASFLTDYQAHQGQMAQTMAAVKESSARSSMYQSQAALFDAQKQDIQAKQPGAVAGQATAIAKDLSTMSVQETQAALNQSQSSLNAAYEKLANANTSGTEAKTRYTEQQIVDLRNQISNFQLERNILKAEYGIKIRQYKREDVLRVLYSAQANVARFQADGTLAGTRLAEANAALVNLRAAMERKNINFKELEVALDTVNTATRALSVVGGLTTGTPPPVIMGFGE